MSCHSCRRATDDSTRQTTRTSCRTSAMPQDGKVSKRRRGTRTMKRVCAYYTVVNITHLPHSPLVLSTRLSTERTDHMMRNLYNPLFKFSIPCVFLHSHTSHSKLTFDRPSTCFSFFFLYLVTLSLLMYLASAGLSTARTQSNQTLTGT